MSGVVSQLDCTDNPSLRLEKGTSQLDPHTSLYKRGLAGCCIEPNVD